MSAKNLNQQMTEVWQRHPTREFLQSFSEDGTSRRFTFHDFFARSSAVSRRLKDLGVGPKDTAILVLPQDAELLFAISGCIQAGIVPTVLAYPNFKLDPGHYQASLTHLVDYLKARVILVSKKLSPQILELIAKVAEGHAGTHILAIEDVPLDGTSIPMFDCDISPHEAAFLQHSSGTTGMRKGVSITHEMCMNQIRHYSKAIQARPEDGVVSWLPLYHDMGLLACFWLPLLNGIRLAQMSPSYWVLHPEEVLIQLFQQKGTLAWFPNFAFSFLARRVADESLPKGFDLSHVRAFVNCSEPVLAGSFKAFAERFQRHGVTPSMLHVSFALAENTFAATQTPMGNAPRHDLVDRKSLQEKHVAIPVNGDAPSLTLVSCGVTIDGTDVRIVDHRGETLPSRHIGQILLRGDSLMRGYYRRPELSQGIFRDGWYQTGDLGYLADEHLFVIGREKDIIIVGGKNLYPQDIEALVSECEGIQAGRTLAIGVPNEALGTEDICIVAERKRSHTPGDDFQLKCHIRKAIHEALDVSPRHVFVVESRWLIKSTSGKIARQLNKEKVLTNLLDGGLSRPPQSPA